MLTDEVLDLLGRHTLDLEQIEHDTGAEVPGRVPMGTPSRAVKFILLSTLFPFSRAHREQPLPSERFTVAVGGA